MVRWAVSGDDVDGLALRLVGGWTFADSSSYNITAFFTIPRTHRYFFFFFANLLDIKQNKTKQKQKQREVSS